MLGEIIKDLRKAAYDGLERIVKETSEIFFKTADFLDKSIIPWAIGIPLCLGLHYLQQNNFQTNETIQQLYELAREHPYIFKSITNGGIYVASFFVTEKQKGEKKVNKGGLAANVAYGMGSGVWEHEIYSGISNLAPGEDFASAGLRTALFNPVYVMFFHIPLYVATTEFGKACTKGVQGIKDWYHNIINFSYLWDRCKDINWNVSRILLPEQFWVMGYADAPAKVTWGNIFGAIAKYILVDRGNVQRETIVRS